MPYDLSGGMERLELDFEQVETIEGKTLNVGQTQLMESIPVKTQGLKNVLNAFYISNHVGRRSQPFVLGEGNY